MKTTGEQHRQTLRESQKRMDFVRLMGRHSLIAIACAVLHACKTGAAFVEEIAAWMCKIFDWSSQGAECI